MGLLRGVLYSGHPALPAGANLKLPREGQKKLLEMNFNANSLGVNIRFFSQSAAV